MAQLKGWDRKVAMSCFTQESSYNDGVDNTTNDNASLMYGYEIGVDFADTIVNDKEEITGYEHGTSSQLTTKGIKITYKEAKTKPHTVAFLGMLAFGSWTSAAQNAMYLHTITPVSHDSDLPSIEVDEEFGHLWHKYKGVKVNSFKLSASAGEPLALEVEMMGSGTKDRQTSRFTTNPDKVEECWLFAHQATIKLETGANISIDATPAIGTQAISGGTPTDISVRLKSFEFTRNNNLEGNYGFGSQVLQELEHKKRENTISLELQFLDETYLDYFNNQTNMALDIEFIGSLVSGSDHYAVKLVIPKFRLAAAPTPTGGVGDFVTCTFDGQVYNDTTNPDVILVVQNSQETYLD